MTIGIEILLFSRLINEAETELLQLEWIFYN